MQIGLNVRDVTVRFNGFVALDKVSLSAGYGDVCGIIGPNGAGKSTLFNVVSGFTQPQTGSVTVDGKELVGRPPWTRLAAGISRSFQDVRVVACLTVVEQLLLARQGQRGERLFRAMLRPHQWSADEKLGRDGVTQLLGSLGLERSALQRASSLSGGQLKLLALAICVATDAPILLLDEPIAGLSEEMRNRVVRFLRELASKGRMIFVIEHDLRAVQLVCDSVVLLEAGRVAAVGRPREILGSDLGREVFLT